MSESIEKALERGDVWKAESLRHIAQREFNLLVQTNGEYISPWDDINEVFLKYEGMQKKDMPKIKGAEWDEIDQQYRPAGRPPPLTCFDREPS